MGVGQAEKQQRIREIVEIAASHGYTHVFAGYGFMAEDAEFIEAIEQAGDRLHGTVVARGAAGGRQGRGEEARARARQRGDPGRRQRVRALALLRARAGIAAGSRRWPRSTGSRSRWDGAQARSRRTPRRCSRPATRSSWSSSRSRSSRPRPRSSAARSGASTRTTGSASSTSAAAAGRVSAWSRGPSRWRAAVMDVLAGVEGAAGRLEPELPDRAQRREHAPQRDPADRQRALVRVARRSRLLGADARAEARRGVAHARAARRRDRARERQDARGPRGRPRHARAHGERGGALRRGDRPRQRVDVRVHRRRASTTSSWR